MMDREVEAISDFLQHFGSFGVSSDLCPTAEQVLREAAALIPRIGGATPSR